MDPRTDRRHGRRRHARGTTLIEAAVVVAIVAIVAGLAAPSFQQMRERRHLEGVAAQLETDLQLARASAVARNATLRVDFVAPGAADGGCYVLHSGNAGDCGCAADGSASCRPGAEPLRAVRLDAATPVRLLSNSRSLAFDPVKGTVTPTATLRVQAAGGAEIRQIVNVMGRVRSCSPGGVVTGYRAC